MARTEMRGTPDRQQTFPRFVSAYKVMLTANLFGRSLCFLAGANSMFYGEKLLTTPNPAPNQDSDLLQDLGLKPMRSVTHVH
jgi:biotin synthase-like enzyme